MPKLINVAGKIKDTRKRLGLTQKDFILAVSKKLNLSTPLNESLASQWESNLKNRANPTDEQLAAIAELTSRPWDTMWWFMRDDIDHKRGYELYPDGQFTIAPPDMLPEQEEELLAGMAAEHKARYSAPIANKLLAWKTEPSTMWSLYEPPEQPIINSQQRALGIAGLIPGTPCKSCGYKNPDLKKFCANCGNQLLSEGIGGLLSSSAFAIGGKSHKPESMTIGAPVKNALLSKAPLKRSGLFVSRGPIVADLVDFPALPPARPNTNEFETAEDYDIEVGKNFWAAVKFFASNDCFIPTEHFNQKIQTGAISQHVNYFDGDRAIQVITIHRHTEMRTLRRSIQNKMMELCFIDRMKKRTSKKLILISTFEKGLKLLKLEENLDELIHSSELLGVHVRFASGPLEVAEGIAAFKTHKTFLD
jgi:transcriptional regulator with XRE-family HTH domain